MTASHDPDRSQTPAHDDITRIVAALTRPRGDAGPLPLVDATRMLATTDGHMAAVARRLTGAFLIALGGGDEAGPARASLADVDETWSEVGAYYLHALDAVPAEVARRRTVDPAFAAALHALATTLEATPVTLTPADVAGRLWSVFFPEGTGILDAPQRHEQLLRRRRTVTVTGPPAEPIVDATTEVLLTANVLLTTPLPTRGPEGLAGVDERIAAATRAAARERQRYLYDHPIPIGIEAQANEILYGLTNLDQAIGFEQQRGTVPADARVPCVLSVSVTHHGLRAVARDYVADVIARAGGLAHLDVYVFAERQTTQVVEQVLAPAARDLLDRDDTDLLDVVGVDGRYGRHYSFLKAVAALWHVAVDAGVRATFKIDLDQVFDQQVLVDQTGRSALEHLAAPLWGARGTGIDGDVELGMLAGALVNERDITASLFTPDVPMPAAPTSPPEHVFFSKLPQALSTAAEMGTRYAHGDPDGVTRVVERVHVTGGTTGARVDALRRHRPFTPSFIARAEDQAFVLASYGADAPRLAYLHADGLIMRHDKEAFAGEAIAAAAVDKLIGDHVRILLFSAYAEALGDVDALKAIVDPFTGCFVSHTPVTTTALRFALQACALLDGDAPDDAVAFVRDGAQRLCETLGFVDGAQSDLVETLDRERRGWDLFYDVLDALEQALARDEPRAIELAAAARRIVAEASIT